MTKEQKYFDALKKISQYDSIKGLYRASKIVGLDDQEHLEMAYENLIETAKDAVKGERRPKDI